MDEATALGRLAESDVGVLATVKPDGGAHLVPVVFASLDSDIVTAIDHKPKTTFRLQRLTNIRSNPRVSLLVHHYTNEWEGLWWVRVDGHGEILEQGTARAEAIEALQAKYPQYRHRPPSGPVITIAVDKVVHWSGSGSED